MTSRLKSELVRIPYTLVVVVALATAFVALDQRETITANSFGDAYDHSVYQFGWPLVAGTHKISAPKLSAGPGLDRTEHWEVRWLVIALNAIAYMVIVACTLTFVHHNLVKIRFGQVSLRTMFVLTAMAAFFVVLMMWELNVSYKLRHWILAPAGAYVPLTLYNWWISLPVLFGVVCTSFVVSNYFVTAVFQVIARWMQSGR